MVTIGDVTHAPDRPCGACGGPLGRIRFWATDHREGLGGRFALRECSACGLVHTDPVPEDLSAWYPATYRNHRERPSITVRAMNTALGYCSRDDRREPLARLLSHVIPNADLGQRLRASSRILDVGAGNGSAVAALRTRGHDAWGIEPSEDAVAAARASGLDAIVTGTLEEAEQLPIGEWDVIRFTHVLEHVPSPVTTLRLAADMLAPGGRIVILVPNFGGLGRTLFRGAWDGLEVPRHIHHFDRRSLRRVLQQSGLAIAALRSVALLGTTPASIDALTCGGRRQRGWGQSLIARIGFYPLDLMVATLGFGDGLVAVATRNPATDGNDRHD